MKIPPGMRVGRIEEFPLKVENICHGWEAVLFLEDQEEPIGGGFSEDRSMAKTIAIAEAIERHLVIEMTRHSKSADALAFGIGDNPTSSGFAVGATAKSALKRAICEAFEHFIRYFGIYLGYRLAKKNFNFQKDKLSEYISDRFERIHFFSIEKHVGEPVSMDLECAIVLAESNGGVFLGAKSDLASSSLLFQHPLLEAWRSLRNFQNSGFESFSDHRKRTTFFATRINEAMEQINKESQDWPQPKLALLHHKYFAEAEVFLARAIFEGVPPWSNLPTNKLI